MKTPHKQTFTSESQLNVHDLDPTAPMCSCPLLLPYHTPFAASSQLLKRNPKISVSSIILDIGRSAAVIYTLV